MPHHWNITGRVPPIKAVMTAFPFSIAAGSSVHEAQRMMAEQGIRHLPVKRGDEIVGVVTERDTRRAPGKELRVEEVMVEALVVDLNHPLDDVLRKLVQRHQDVALVVREGKLAGIFTAMDGCRVLSETLSSLSPPGPGDEVA
jgi:acetoin utilization protein AcuB